MREYFNNIFTGTEYDFLKKIESNLINNNKLFIVTANPETFMTAKRDSELNTILLDQEISVIPDGIGIVKAAKDLGYNNIHKITGIDITNKLISLSADKDKTIYFYGSTEKVQENLIKQLTIKFPNLKIAGNKNGYDFNEEEIAEEILKLSPDVILAALGVPKQEKFIYKLFKQSKKGVFIGIGGALDILSGEKKRAPIIIRKLNMEWIYRITMEPKRLKRFYTNNIKFMLEIRNLKKQEK